MWWACNTPGICMHWLWEYKILVFQFFMEFKYMSFLWLTKPTLKETKTYMHSKECIGMFLELTCVNKSSYRHIWTDNIIFTIPDNRKKTIHLTKEWIPKTHWGKEGLNKMFVLFNCLYSLRKQVNKMLVKKIQTSECLEKVQGWGGRRHRRGLPWSAANVILHNIWHQNTEKNGSNYKDFVFVLIS